MERTGILRILRKIYIVCFLCMASVVIFFEFFPVPRPFQTLAAGSHITTLAFTSNGKIVVGTVNDVQQWSATTYEREGALDGAVGPAAFTTSGPYIAAVLHTDAKDGPRTVGIWNSTTGDAVARLTGHTDTVTALTFNADGALLASASEDSTVRVWRMDDMRLAHTLTWDAPSEHAIAWSPDGRWLATSDGGSTIELWSTDDWHKERTVATDENAIHSLAFSPTSQTLVAGGRWAFIKLWNVDSGRLVGDFEGHIDDVNVVLYSADGQRLVSASGSTDGPKGGTDSAIHVWDARIGTSLQEFRGSLDMIRRRKRIMTAAAIDSDGSIVAGGDAQGTVRLWHMHH